MPAFRPRFRLHPRAAAGALLLAAIGAGAANASVISRTPTLPPTDAVYVGKTGPGCFPVLGVCVGPGTLAILSVVSSTFGPSGQELKLDTRYTSAVTDLGSVPLGEVVLTGEAIETVSGRTGPTDTGSWPTSLDALDLSGSVLGFPADLGLDPAHASGGETSIVPLGQNFRISSFFDVFVTIQIDTPAGPLTATRGPIRADLVPAPEPGTFALLISALLGTAFVRRPRKSAAAV